MLNKLSRLGYFLDLGHLIGMKQLIFLLFIFASLNSFGQSKINVLNGALSEKYQDTNIVYSRGVYNELIFEINNQIDTNLTVIYRNDTLKRYTHSNYYLFEPLDDSIGFVKLFHGSIFLDSVKLRVKKPGRLELKFGEITSDTTISIETFLKNNDIGMIPYYPYCMLKVCTRVTKLYGYVIRGGKKHTFEEIGDKFSSFRRRVKKWSYDKLDRNLQKTKFWKKYYGEYRSYYRFKERELNYLRNLKSGDKIVFQMARLQCPSCSSAKKSVNYIIMID